VTQRRGRAVLALGALAIACGVAGAAIDHAVVARAEHRDALSDTTFHPLSSILRSPTPADRQAYRAQLSKTLGLTPAQDSAIDRVQTERAGEFEALRQEIRPRVDLLVSDFRTDIEKVLTDPQRVAFRKLQQRAQPQVVSNAPRP
jgi:hypothetical protein